MVDQNRQSKRSTKRASDALCDASIVGQSSKRVYFSIGKIGSTISLSVLCYHHQSSHYFHAQAKSQDHTTEISIESHPRSPSFIDIQFAFPKSINFLKWKSPGEKHFKHICSTIDTQPWDAERPTHRTKSFSLSHTYQSNLASSRHNIR